MENSRQLALTRADNNFNVFFPLLSFVFAEQKQSAELSWRVKWPCITTFRSFMIYECNYRAVISSSFSLFFCIFTSHRRIWSSRHKYQHTLYNIFDGTLCSHCNVTLEPFSTYFLTTKRTSTSDCPSANRNRIEIEKWNKKMNEKIKWMKSGEKLQQFKLRQTIMFYCSERYFWLRFDELLSLRFECSK